MAQEVGALASEQRWGNHGSDHVVRADAVLCPSSEIARGSSGIPGCKTYLLE
jgi:hypothetical protein